MTDPSPTPPASQDLTTNPIETVNPKSLDELFDMDPEKLTVEDRQRIVERLRAGRKTFAQAEEAKKKPAVQNTKGLPTSLDDLFA